MVLLGLQTLASARTVTLHTQCHTASSLHFAQRTRIHQLHASPAQLGHTAQAATLSDTLTHRCTPSVLCLCPVSPHTILEDRPHRQNRSHRPLTLIHCMARATNSCELPSVSPSHDNTVPALSDSPQPQPQPMQHCRPSNLPQAQHQLRDLLGTATCASRTG